MMTLEQAKQTPYAWPGGYPVYALMADGEMLCYKCLTTEPEVFEGGHSSDGESNDWRFIGADIYWEGPTLQCRHCNNDLEAAYGDPDED